MVDKRIYVVDLESVPTRYTCEWKDHIPNLLREEIKERNLNIEVINISGGESTIEATPGAFLNFQQTNIYKNNQLNNIAERFTSEVKPNDVFLFTDAWNTGILQLKYMSELLNIPIEISALWHAGSYDPQDFLGRLIRDKKWTYATERAIYHAVDYNWFATRFHSELFSNTLDVSGGKSHITGWPMDYMPAVLNKYKSVEKEDIIIFPHRIAPEKQPEIFRDLAKYFPEYEFVVCQDEKLSKEQYHKLLAKSKIMWSANLQETLGISPFEGAILGVVPLLPNRLSYTEMYGKKYLYPGVWTASFSNYEFYRENIIRMIKDTMEEYDVLRGNVENHLAPQLLKNFFNATNLVDNLLRNKNEYTK